jgi:hypothetical protein
MVFIGVAILGCHAVGQEVGHQIFRTGVKHFIGGGLAVSKFPVRIGRFDVLFCQITVKTDVVGFEAFWGLSWDEYVFTRLDFQIGGASWHWIRLGGIQGAVFGAVELVFQL